MSQQVTTTVRIYHSPLQRLTVWMGQQLASGLFQSVIISSPWVLAPRGGEDDNDSRADVRLRAHLQTPPAAIIPAEDDDELLDAPPDIDVPISTAVSSALTHLEQAIDDMHSASPTPLSLIPFSILLFPVCPYLPMAHPHYRSQKFSPSHGSTRPDAPGCGSDLCQSEIPTCSCSKQFLQRPCPRRGAYNFGSSQPSTHASKSTAPGLHCRVLLPDRRLCKSARWCFLMLFRCPELLTCVHVCMLVWLRAGEASTSFVGDGAIWILSACSLPGGLTHSGCATA